MTCKVGGVPKPKLTCREMGQGGHFSPAKNFLPACGVNTSSLLDIITLILYIVLIAIFAVFTMIARVRGIKIWRFFVILALLTLASLIFQIYVDIGFFGMLLLPFLALIAVASLIYLATRGRA